MHPGPTEIDPGQSPGSCFELVVFKSFHSEGFDDPVANNRLLEDIRDLLHLVLAGTAGLLNLSPEKFGGINDQRRQSEGNQGQSPIDGEDQVKENQQG